MAHSYIVTYALANTQSLVVNYTETIIEDDGFFRKKYPAASWFAVAWKNIQQSIKVHADEFNQDFN